MFFLLRYAWGHKKFQSIDKTELFCISWGLIVLHTIISWTVDGLQVSIDVGQIYNKILEQNIVVRMWVHYQKCFEFDYDICRTISVVIWDLFQNWIIICFKDAYRRYLSPGKMHYHCSNIWSCGILNIRKITDLQFIQNFKIPKFYYNLDVEFYRYELKLMDIAGKKVKIDYVKCVQITM